MKKILTYHSGSYAAAVLHDGLRVMTLKNHVCGSSVIKSLLHTRHAEDKKWEANRAW